MADRISQEQRSRNMAAVRSRGNNTTELALKKLFRKTGITGWQRNQTISGVHPDFVFIRKRVVIFVHGCFWHGCKRHCIYPKTNKLFWNKKIEDNIRRDREVLRKMKNRGWTVLVIWEHQIKSNPEKVLIKIRGLIQKSNYGRKRSNTRF